MAQFITQCPRCKQKFNVPSEWIGQNISCPSCGSMFMIRQEQQIVMPDQFNPIMQQNATACVSEKSTASLVIGIINCLMWLLPIIGIPLGIVGLVLGCRKKYNTGILLNAITLTAAAVNAIFGAILGAQGKLF